VRRNIRREVKSKGWKSGMSVKSEKRRNSGEKLEVKNAKGDLLRSTRN
jgi:hypothetical protein